MSLNAVRKSLDDLSDELKKEYKPGTGDYAGMFVLDVTPHDSFELADTTGLKSALSKERTAASEAQKALKAYEGLDPAKARDALSKVSEIDNWDPDKKLAEHKAKFEKDVASKYEAQAKQISEKYEAELAGVKGVNEKLLGNVQQMSVINVARAALNEHGGSADLLLPHIERQVRTKFDPDSGKVAVEVVDADGNVRISTASGSSAPMSISELVGVMKNDDKYKAAFAGSGATGSGSTGATGARTGPDGKKYISKSDQDAIDASIEDIAAGKVVVTD